MRPPDHHEPDAGQSPTVTAEAGAGRASFRRTESGEMELDIEYRVVDLLGHPFDHSSCLWNRLW